MKVTAQTLTEASTAEKGWVSVYADLFKARLTSLVLLTTLVGFYLGFRGPVNYLLMLHLLMGTALMPVAPQPLTNFWNASLMPKCGARRIDRSPRADCSP